jgi:outer membrane protein OmpA-like peptidoglycan-associated protein
MRSHLTRGGRTAAALAAVLLVTACATMPPENPQVSAARAELFAARANPGVVRAAALELQQAEAALSRAEQAWNARQDIDETRHLAYLARQRVAIANEVGARHAAEQRVQQADAERERVRAEARQREAQLAEQRARTAQQEAIMAQQQASAAQQQAAQAQLQMQTAKAQADSAAQRAQRLEQELQQLEAKQTQRGMVVTLGDVLFDTGSAELRSGAVRSLERLAGVLRDYPERRILIEGFTDSTGSASTNLSLSERRADAVRQALILRGVPPEQIEVRAFGQAHPVASNDTPEGRQLNRRVEVVFSDASGRFASR